MAGSSRGRRGGSGGAGGGGSSVNAQTVLTVVCAVVALFLLYHIVSPPPAQPAGTPAGTGVGGRPQTATALTPAARLAALRKGGRAAVPSLGHPVGEDGAESSPVPAEKQPDDSAGVGAGLCPPCETTECPPAPECGGEEACAPCEACPACPVCPGGGVRGGAGLKLQVGDDDYEVPVIEAEPQTAYAGEDFSPRDPVNIIYLHSPFHWPWHLDHWLRAVARPVRMYIDKKGAKCMHNSIVVVNHLAVKRENRGLDPNNYFKTCKAAGVTNIGVFHTGDLSLDQNYDYYHKAAFVYRNHYPTRQQIKQLRLPEKKIRLLPLGSITLDSISLDNFYQTLPSMRRSHLCGFVGALAHSKTRQAMADGMKRAKLIPSKDTYKLMGTGGGFQCAVYFSTSRWKDKQQMQPHEMRALISNSVFAPVPLGRGPDSFRLYEALELGAIPIITDHDAFNLPFGKHPLPMLKASEWGTKLGPLLKKYHDDRPAMFELQKRVFRWWVKWKYEFRKRMASDVERLFE